MKKKLLFDEENQVKSKEISRKSLLKVQSSLFGCDRPGSTGNVNLLQCEIAFENNEGIPETFGSDCIITGQGKFLTKVFKDCEKKRKHTVTILYMA